VGIPDESIPHLFENSTGCVSMRAKFQGTGLGLSISKQIIQGHNGRIEVRSKMGVGTSFQCTFTHSAYTKRGILIVSAHSPTETIFWKQAAHCLTRICTIQEIASLHSQ
jgi:hypothetical protein